MGHPSCLSTLLKKLFILIFVILGMVYTPCIYASTDINYVTTNLSNNYGHSFNQKLARSDGFTYAVWTDVSNSSNISGQIYFKSSNDSKANFGKNMILSNKGEDANLPDISANDNFVYLTWVGDYSDNSQVFFRASSDNGKTFSKIINISNDIIESTLPSVASFKNFVYIVWVGSNMTTLKNFEVFLRVSHDSGKSFGPLIDLSKSPGDSTDPHVIVPTDGNMVYVVYTDCDATHDDPLCGIYFTKSSDNGITFGSPQLISIIPPVNQYLPFLGHSHPPIISSLLSAFGINIHKHKGEHNSVIPIITSSEDGKDVYILWQDDLTQTGATDIFFRKSNDYGNTFSDSINLSNTPGVSRLPRMVSLGSALYVIWSDTNATFSQFDIFFTKLGDHGNKLEKPINLSDSKGNSAPSAIGVVNNSKAIYVAWTVSAANNKNNLMITKSTDEGNTFEKPIQLGLNNSLNPALIPISDKNSTGLIWTEYGNNYEDIYFAKVR